MSLTPAGPLDVVDVLRAERAAFLHLLRSLEGPDWTSATECPAYDVQGVAAHILGDDLSLLSRQRDSAPPGLLQYVAEGDDFRTALNRFNDRWVDAAQFFSPALLIDLLDLTGRWTADWYAAVDHLSLGEPVGLFAATGPSPYWQISAREYVERWVHQHQIRRALGREDLAGDEFLLPAAAVVVRSVAAHLGELDVAPDTLIVLSIDRLADWTLLSQGGTWTLLDGRPPEAVAELRLDRAAATSALGRGLPPDEVEAAFSISGNSAVGRRIAARLAALAGR